MFLKGHVQQKAGLELARGVSTSLVTLLVMCRNVASRRNESRVETMMENHDDADADAYDSDAPPGGAANGEAGPKKKHKKKKKKPRKKSAKKESKKKKKKRRGNDLTSHR